MAWPEGPPWPGDVADFLGAAGDSTAVERAGAHLPVVSAMVYAYTHGNGFDETGNPAPDLAAVIIASTARSVRNPEHNVTAGIDDYSVRYGIFDGWTLPELAILHRYRRRAA